MTDFVVTPNHAHLLAPFLDEDGMLDQCESWKHFTARKINRTSGSSGHFWQQDGFDYLIRPPTTSTRSAAISPTTARKLGWSQAATCVTRSRCSQKLALSLGDRLVGRANDVEWWLTVDRGDEVKRPFGVPVMERLGYFRRSRLSDAKDAGRRSDRLRRHLGRGGRGASRAKSV